jgi:hypothetical protein
MRDNDLGLTCDVRLPSICRERVHYAITYKDHAAVSDSRESVPSDAGPVILGEVALACTQCTAALCQIYASASEWLDDTTVLRNVLHVQNLRMGAVL